MPHIQYTVFLSLALMSFIPTAAWLLAACQSAASLSVFTILPACLLVYRLSVYLCAFLTVGSLSICCQPVCIYHPACLLGCLLSVIPTAAWLLAACQSAASLSVFTILSVCLPLRLFDWCQSICPLYSYMNVCLIFLIFYFKNKHHPRKFPILWVTYVF